ncbi:outer membrane protein assembly factor BamB family protein [Halostagnicola kamekurae]|uniref:Outer membrane protein assembly factor BamB, contains PQQ-like beta-propeller repeat n=1 Tax=Halostagnicola kamekurae TaxID=619731 RepID=A0A1I6TUW1_9EURY|nr:PQQ-binding-like beta-propeller repeat protein [Halostagnicola kamekurae]SFS92950.1 Outer membrane protein assembly factor BamB, contains PQQ-like beta-propeller repeat [Halostagnicola kamekurae]
MKRRRLLEGAGAVGSATLVGCLGFADDGTGSEYQWRYDAGGEIDAVSQGVVFGREWSDGQIVALEGTTGERQWAYGATAGMDTYSDLTVTDTGIYFGYCTDDDCIGLYALKRDGEERWRDESVGTGHTSPFVVDGVVFVSDSVGIVRAFDAESGSELWTDGVDESDTIASGSGIVDIADAVYVEKSAALVALDRDGGSTRWRYDPDDGDTQIIDAAVSDGVAYVTTGGWVAGVADGDEVWRRSVDAVDVQTEIAGITTDRLFVLANADRNESRLYAFDRTSGERSVLSESLEHPDDESGPVTAVRDGVVYVGTDRLRAIDAATGNERFSVTVDGGPIWSLAVPEENGADDHTVFVRVGKNRLISVDSSGERTWDRSVAGTLRNYLVDESVYVGTTEGIYSLEWRVDA